MQVGDRVCYVPHQCHALESDASGEFPWVMEYVHANGKKEVLEGRRAHEVITALKRYPDPSEEFKKIRFLYPARTWTATVRGINDNNTVNLDVQSNRGGVTLHYDNVLVDDVAKQPHSCHKEV